MNRRIAGVRDERSDDSFFGIGKGAQFGEVAPQAGQIAISGSFGGCCGCQRLLGGGIAKSWLQAVHDDGGHRQFRIGETRCEVASLFDRVVAG